MLKSAVAAIAVFAFLIAGFVIAFRAFREGNSEEGALYLCAAVGGVYGSGLVAFIIIEGMMM